MPASYNPSSGAPKLFPRNPGYGKRRKAKEKQKKKTQKSPAEQEFCEEEACTYLASRAGGGSIDSYRLHNTSHPRVRKLLTHALARNCCRCRRLRNNFFFFFFFFFKNNGFTPQQQPPTSFLATFTNTKCFPVHRNCVRFFLVKNNFVIRSLPYPRLQFLLVLFAVSNKRNCKRKHKTQTENPDDCNRQTDNKSSLSPKHKSAHNKNKRKTKETTRSRDVQQPSFTPYPDSNSLSLSLSVLSFLLSCCLALFSQERA